ncbi:MAG: glycosyltransferase [Verrucomicrobiota bacterium]
MQTMLRVDLHLVSRFSDRPSEWFLRKLGVPQSYSEPAALYDKLDAKGMAFKTITDRNRIDGCLEIADRPGVFLSTEVTARFPDDTEVSLLVWRLSEAQHRELQRLRHDLYDTARYLREQRLPHAVGTPLANPSKTLRAEHFEKLILLFRHFETINASRVALEQEVAELCLRALTPETIARLAEEHRLEPAYPDAHQKVFVAGSHDQSGLGVADAYTEAPGRTLDDFFAALDRGEVVARGSFGNPLRFSTSVYTTVFKYAQTQLQERAPLGASLLKQMAERFMAGKNPAAFSLGERVGHVTEAIRTGQAFDFLKPGETTLSREIGTFFADARVRQELDRIIAEEPNAERRSFRMASYLTNQLSYRLGQQCLQRIQRGNLLDAFQAVTGMLPVGSTVIPYWWAFHLQAPDRELLAAVSRRLTCRLAPQLANKKRAWFTDTLEDVNGVARTIHTMTKAGRRAGADITVVTSRGETTIHDIPIKNFPPVGEFELPEYELQKLSWPPILEILDYVESEGFTELIISTPGPVGLCALAAAKVLGLPTSGIYHTDFPQYARYLSEDALMESLTWNYMQWFYGQCNIIYSNSDFYRKRWIERGIPAERQRILGRGLDTEIFNRRHRREDYWPSRGASGPVLLYVGRISKEKDLAFLAEVLTALKARGAVFTPAFVGDGPYREELAAQVPEAIFTGILRGKELGTAYASADLFVFPSTTDTFGNVVIEAMASGLRAFVSDIGGPRELVTRPEEGQVLPARNATAWTDTLAQALAAIPTPAQRQALADRIHEERNWNRAFQDFWHRDGEEEGED